VERLTLNQQEDWQTWKQSMGRYSGIDFDKEPTHYPCILLWFNYDIRGSKHDGGGHDFVYREDLEKL